MKRNRHAQRFRQRQRKRSAGAIERLESRFALAGANQVLRIDGEVTISGGASEMPLHFPSEIFSAGGGAVSLGFHVRGLDTSTLDPAHVVIRRGDHSLVSPTMAADDVGETVDSLAIASIGPGDYTLAVTGEEGTIGAFTVEAFLVGDVNSDRTVDRADAAAMVAAYGADAASEAYLTAADADLDGTVSLADLARLQGNLGGALELHPLFVYARIDPDPVELANGSLVSTTADFFVMGVSQPGATIRIDADRDGAFDDGSAVAGEDGAYSIAMSLADGSHAVAVRGSDAVGQLADSTIDVVVDATDPSAPVVHLHPDSETGAIDDRTTHRFVSLVGTTEPGAIVSLEGSELSTVAAADGTFRLDSVPLKIGANHLYIRARDVAGRQVIHVSPIMRIESAETDGPRLNWGLVWDTGEGLGASDRVTSFGGVSIAMVELSSVVHLSLGGANGTNLAPMLDEFNNLVLSREELEFHLGRPLAQGMNTMMLTAVDEWGNESQSPLSFLFDTTAPYPPEYTLDPAYDTGAPGDRETDLGLVRIEGYTDSNLRLRLDEYDRWTTSDASGYFAFDDVPLRFAVNFPAVHVFDETGNTVRWDGEFYRPIPDVDVAAPDVSAWLANAPGADGELSTTNAPIVRGVAFDLTDVVRLDGWFADAATADVTNLLGDMDAGGHFVLDGSRLEAIYGEPLVDGEYEFFVQAEDSLGHVQEYSFAFQVDRSGPSISAETLTDGGVVRPGFRLRGSASTDDAPLVAVEYQWENRPALAIGFNPGTGSFEGDLILTGLVPGPQTLTLRAIDAAGNQSSQTYRVTVSAEKLYDLFVYQTSPLDGTLGANIHEPVRVDFSQPVDPTTLTAMSFYAKHNGVKVPATIVTSNDRMSAWLDFDAPLPADADIEVTLEGNRIRTPQFKQLSTDNDLPNFEVFGFHTLSTNTGGEGVLSGRIVGPGPDRLPRTADDFSAGIDGIAGTDDDEYFWPIEGASVYFVGREFDATFTDSEGRFFQEDAPQGAGQVVVDATTIPAHYGYFPRLTVPVWIEPGQEHPLVADGDVAYIADVSNGHWTFFDATQPARMPLVADAAYNVASEDQRWMWLDIPANGVMDASGAPVTEAWSGISVLPPDVVRQVLPEGPLQEAFGFLVENDLFARFSAAPSLSLPNVFAQAPGTRQMVLGQDRMTGEFAAIGTAAVSADGTHLTSDAGLNLFEPGMFVLAPPGMYLGTPLARDDGEVIPEPDRIPSDSLFPFPGIGFSPEMGPQPAASGGTPNRPEFCRHTGDGIAPPGGAPKTYGTFSLFQDVNIKGAFSSDNAPLDHFFYQDGDSVKWTFEAAPKKKIHPYQDCYDFQPVDIKIEFDQPAFDKFLQSELKSNETFSLGLKNPRKVFTLNVKSLADQIKKYSHDQLFGVKLRIYSKRPDESSYGKPAEIRLFRLFEVQDKEHSGGTISMPRVAPGHKQKRLIDAQLGPGLEPPKGEGFTGDSESFKVEWKKDQASGKSTGHFLFQPHKEGASDGMKGDGLKSRIRWVLGESKNAGGKTSKTYFDEQLKIEGDSKTQYVYIDIEKLEAKGKALAIELAQYNLRDSVKAELNSALFGDRVLAKVTEHLKQLDGSIKLGKGGISVDVWDTAQRRDPLNSRGNGILGQAIDASADQFAINDVAIGYFRNLTNFTNAGQVAYELSQAVNKNYTGKVDIYLDNFLVKSVFPLGLVRNEARTTGDQMIERLAASIVHEIGHHLSLRHTGIGALSFDSGGQAQNEVMTQGLGKTAFKLSEGLARMATGAGWTEANYRNALTYLEIVHGRPWEHWFAADHEDGVDNDVVGHDEPFGPILHLIDPNSEEYFDNVVSFGNVVGSGNGAAIASRTFELLNPGDEDLVISSTTFAGQGFSISGISNGTVIPPLGSTEITISLAPNATGAVSAALTIESNSVTGPLEISLTADVTSASRDARLIVPNNNLGGVALSAAIAARDDVGTVTNVGMTPLAITNLQIVGGDGQFSLVRLPAGFGPGNPIIVAPGEAYPVAIAFDAKAIGLQNARLVVTTNDADTPQMSVTLVGTGLADDGEALSRFRNYVGIKASDETGTAEYHLRTNGAGHWNTFLRPDSEYAVTLFDAASGLVYRDVGTTGVSGLPQFAGDEPQFDASVEPDSDGDGLPDDIEFALGTKSDETDSDGDGVSDFDEFEFGVAPPEAPQPEPLAPLVYNSNNFAVSATVVDGPSASDPTYGYVGAFRGGLAVYDATNAASPSLLGAVPITGFVIGVDADPGTQTLGVAGETGLHLLDIANPARPTLLRSISVGFGGAQFVELYDGAAYVTAGNDVVGYTLKKIDLETGEIAQSIPLNTPGTSQNVTGFVRDGEFLYTMNRLSNVLRIFDISGPSVVARGSLVLNGGSGGLAVRNGVAYVGNTFRLDNIFATAWGYSTVNVSNADQPTLIAALIDAPHPQVPGNSIVVSDSGVALFGGTIGTTFTGLKVVNVSNPLVSTVTGTIARTHAPQIMGLGDGRALVPSLQLGLAMVDFVAADAPATPPAVLLSTDAVDVNPTKPGVQVYEGTTVRIIATSNDNLLTRNVDVLANGVAIARDVTPAFDEFVAVAPRVGPSGASWTLQGRASDRAGNVGLSPVTTLEIVPVAPRIVTAFPLPGEATTRIVDSLSLTFSEAMDTALFSVGDYALTAAGGDEAFGTADDQTIDIASVEPATDGRGVRLVLDGPLAPGNYRVTVNDEWIRDPMGNRLDGEAAATLPSGNGSAGGDYVHSFTVLAAPTMPPSQFAGEVFPLYPIEPRFIDNYTKPSGPLVSIDATGDGVADAVQIVSQVLLVAGGVGTVETAAAFLSVVPGTGGGGFAAPVLSPVINHASQLALADVDRDGFVDAVVGGTLPIGDDNPVMRAQVLIYFGRPGGTFSTATLLADVENVLSLDGLAIADLNRDARLDVAMLARGPSYTFVADLVGDGFGEFTVRNVDVLDPNRGDARLWSADINGDGITDLVTDRRLLTNDGTSYTNALPVAQGQAIRGVADFTSDGKPDLLVERVDGSTGKYLVRVLERASDNTWTSHPELDIGSSIVVGTYAIGDLTGDGRADFAVASSGPPFSGGSLIQVSSAGGTLSEISRRVIGVVPQSLATASRASDATRDLLASVHYGGIADAAGVALFAGKSGGPVETPIASGPTLENVAVGDFNGDTRLDRIGYDAQVPARALLLELGNGDGTFGNPVTISSWSANFEPHAPIATDMNGDGKLDIVAAAGAGGIGIYYFRGRGDGTFDPATVLFLGSVDGYSVADMNLDARPDAVFRSSYRLQNADGTFAPPVGLSIPSSITGTVAWTATDVTGDGRPDIVAATATTVAVLVNQPGLTFTASETTDVGGAASPRQLEPGDVNGDGRADLIVLKFNEQAPQLLLANADGTFRDGGSFAAIGSASAARIADLNGDARNDVVFSTGFGVEVLLGYGDGTFQAGKHRLLARRSIRIAVGDVDGDGLLDLLAGNAVHRRR